MTDSFKISYDYIVNVLKINSYHLKYLEPFFKERDYSIGELTNKVNDCYYIAIPKIFTKKIDGFEYFKLSCSFIELFSQMAKNLQTNESVLKILSNFDDKHIRSKVSKNKNTPIEILKAMASNECVNVLYSLASNENLTDEMFDEIIKSNDIDIFYALVENPKTPERILKMLLKCDKILDFKEDQGYDYDDYCCICSEIQEKANERLVVLNRG